MGADIQNLRGRIGSVRSTLHLTKAMGLVASSKIRKAHIARNTSKQYADSVSEIVDMLSACNECKNSAYMKKNDSEKIKLVVIAGDRGLAGGYNSNIVRFLREFKDADIVAIGKKACDRFGQPLRSSEKISVADVQKIADELCEEYKNGAYGKIGIVYTKYISMLAQEPVCKWLFPIEPKENAAPVNAVFEPDETVILEQVVPTYVGGMIYAAVRESFASEVVARRTAMDSAGKNATAMLDDLQLQYNRARQSSITQEITEIVAGSGE